ncbi:hypothetical protein GLOIN_2v1505199, partial [Rhizophagus irregularis DAOM 181602=DAOM 197198]
QNKKKEFYYSTNKLKNIKRIELHPSPPSSPIQYSKQRINNKIFSKKNYFFPLFLKNNKQQIYESGHTEVAGIFKKGFEDTKASYGFKIVDECKNTLFDLTDGLNIKVDGCGGTKSFRHKFTNMSIDCDDNGILTKTLHHSKRHCNSSKFKKRGPNGAMTTQNGEGHGYAGLSK